MKVQVLGPVELVASVGSEHPARREQDAGARRDAGARSGSTVTPQRLIDAVWGEQEVNGPNVVQVAVSKLRRVLADAEVRRPDHHRSGRLPARTSIADAVDALRFETLVDQARDMRSTIPTRVANVLGDALALWRGAPARRRSRHGDLTGAIRSRLEEMRRGAVEDWSTPSSRSVGIDRLAPELEALVAAEPLRERRWGQLIRALYGSGRQADALRAFQVPATC